MPQRFRFVDIAGLNATLRGVDAGELDLYLTFQKGDPSLAGAVDASNFLLHCTPAINLFERRCDRIIVTRRDAEQHVVVNNTAPMDYEVYSVTSVKGIARGGAADTDFLPFYAEGAFTPLRQAGPAYFTQRRRFQQKHGTRCGCTVTTLA